MMWGEAGTVNVAVAAWPVATKPLGIGIGLLTAYLFAPDSIQLPRTIYGLGLLRRSSDLWRRFCSIEVRHSVSSCRVGRV